MKSRILLSLFCFLLINSALAVRAGGFHGGGAGPGPRPNDHFNGAYHNNIYNNQYHNAYDHHDNVWYGDGLYDDGATNVVVGVPDGGYYDPSCQSVENCDSDGECVTEQTCD